MKSSIVNIVMNHSFPIYSPRVLYIIYHISLCVIYHYTQYIIIYHISGGRLCTLIDVPWRGVSFSTFSTGRFVLKQHICKGAESAEHAETAGYTYEGTQTTA